MFRAVTVSSEFGSGGALIAGYVAETLGWKLLDDALIGEIAYAAQVSTEIVSRYDEHVDSWWRRFNRGGLRSAAICAGIAPDDAQFFDGETEAAIARQIIDKAAHEGDCVIVGRGAQCVLQCCEDVLHVFVYAPWADRVERARRRLASGQDAEGLIHATDRQRASFIQTYYKCDWKNPHLYHLMLSSTLGTEQTGWIIIDAIDQWGTMRTCSRTRVGTTCTLT